MTEPTTAEIRKRHEYICMIGKKTGREHQQSDAHKDRGILLDKLEAVKAIVIEYCESSWCGKSPNKYSDGLCPYCEIQALLEKRDD